MRFSFDHFGSTAKTERKLQRLLELDISKVVASQAKRGVDALAHSTPIDTGQTARSWSYEIKKTSRSTTIYWTNSDIENGFAVAVAIQYGHGTGTGGYIQGIDYINPAMRPVFEDIAKTVWKAVISA